MLNILLPAQAVAIGGEAAKGQTVGWATAFLGVTGLLGPLFGTLSDRTPTRWGRRRPWILIGTAFDVAGLIFLGMLPLDRGSTIPLLAGFAWTVLFSSLTLTAYLALLPDTLPVGKRASAATWMGFMSLLGSLTGAILGTQAAVFGIRGAYFLVSAIACGGTLVTGLLTKEVTPRIQSPPFSWKDVVIGVVTPFRSRTFSWVFVTRSVVETGNAFFIPFLFYFVRDVLPRPYLVLGTNLGGSPEVATGMILMLVLVPAPVGALLAGAMSTRFRQATLLRVCTGIRLLILFVYMFLPSTDIVALLAPLLGLSGGGLMALWWGLATDALPSSQDHAKDFALLNLAIFLPALVTPVAGLVLDAVQAQGPTLGLPLLGYSVVLGSSCTFLLLGIVLLGRVQSEAAPKPQDLCGLG